MYRNSTGTRGAAAQGPVRERTSAAARWAARLRATRYDRLLAVGSRPAADSLIAVHHDRLISEAERHAVATSLRQVLAESSCDSLRATGRVPLQRGQIRDAADLIDRITLRLHGPGPVGARGMARLRLLLADGAGPLYRCGGGDLRGRLGAAFAEL